MVGSADSESWTWDGVVLLVGSELVCGAGKSRCGSPFSVGDLSMPVTSILESLFASFPLSLLLEIWRMELEGW